MSAKGTGGGPRRVLYVENGIGYGGAIICLRHLARQLDRARYRPLIVTGRTGPEYETIPQDAEWVHIADRHLDVPSVRRRWEGQAWFRRSRLLGTLASQGLARLDDLVNFLPFFTRLLLLALRFRPHLVHANNEPLCNRAALLVGKLLRVPTVCHVRGDQSGSLMMGWAYRLPDHFIPVSHWVSESIGRLGIPPERRTVVYDGIPLEEMDVEADGAAFRARLGVPREAFAVGLIGLLIPWKGQDLFLDAARILKDRIPNLRMLFIGGTPAEYGPYERHLRERVAQEGLDGVVVFVGHVADMPPVYNGLDVVVSASTSPEPLGTVVIEAMAMGRPLVAPNHGGAAEMTVDGETALLFAPASAEGLAVAIARYHAEPALARAIGHAARESALARFDVGSHAANVASVYEALC